MECESAMRVWKARAEALIDEEPPATPERSLHVNDSLDGQYHGQITLDPDGGEIVSVALALAETDDADGEPARTPAQRRADRPHRHLPILPEHARGRPQAA